MRNRHLWWWMYCGGVLLFLFTPPLMVVLFAFDAGGRSSFPMQGLTLRWFEDFVDNDVMVDAALNSLSVAVCVGAITMTLGTLAAFALVRYRVRYASVASGLITMPIVLPALMIGIALLSFFGWAEVQLSLWTAVIGQVLVTLPFFVLTLSSRLASLVASVEEAAATLGANRVQVVRHVTFPLIRSSLVGSSLIVLALSLDEFLVTFFTIGSDNTLPTVIWGQMRAGVSPIVNAISTVMLAATLSLMLLVRKFTEVRFH